MEEFEANKMIELLKNGDIRVVTEPQIIFSISFTRKNSVIYFHNNGLYDSYSVSPSGLSYKTLLGRLSLIIRIEKRIDSEYYPIWTKEDGEIMRGENFVKLRGRYYTIYFLEQLIDKISEFKKMNI
jgi:hypothetical protein